MIKRRNLDDEVYDVLLHKIMHGEYEAGEKIRLENLAAELQTSITPISSALRQLQYRGLVTSKRGSGFHVAFFTREDLLEILDALTKIYMLAFDYIVRSEHFGTILQELTALSEYSQLTLENSTYEDYLRVDNLFHETIVQQLNNRYLFNFYADTYRKACLYYQLQADSAKRGRSSARPENHVRICQALQEKDMKALQEIVISDFPLP